MSSPPSGLTPRQPRESRSRFRRLLSIGLPVLVVVVAAVLYLLRLPAEPGRVVQAPPAVIDGEPEPADESDTSDELWRAAKKGDFKRIEALLAEGVDPDAETEYGVTALHFAAARGHLDIVRLLLEHGADVNSKDRFYGVTPLLSAAEKKRWQVVAALLESGAEGREQILPAAAAAGELDLVRLILDTGNASAAILNQALAATPRDRTEIIAWLETAGAKRVESSAAENGAGPAGEPSGNRVPRSLAGSLARPDPEGDGDPDDLVPQNWPSFRGPQAAGVADGQKPPTTWDVENGINLRWRTPIAGLAHACPVVWDDRVYIATAVRAAGDSELKVGIYGDVDSADDLTEHSWLVSCLDRNSGDVLWERVAHRGVPRTKRHTKGSHANSTPATDGTHVVVNFGSEGLFCYDRDGGRLWHKRLGTLDSGWFFDEDYQWGFGSSPVIFRDLAIVQCDVGRGSFIAAFRLADGTEAWRTPRDEIPSWGSPTVIEGPDRVELVTNATHFARGYDPATGAELWRLARQSEITVPTPFYAEGLIFIASGYSPIQPIYAIRPGASGDISLAGNETSNPFIAWSRPRGGPYLPTPIAYHGRLYVCSNNGIVACFDASQGREIYKRRLPGAGAFTASPVAADGKVYFTDEQGQTVVLKAGAKFEVLARNALGEVCLATPAISAGMIFFRTERHVVAVGRRSNRTRSAAARR